MALQRVHYQHSTYREKLLEHIFLGELLQCGWLANPQRRVDVVRPEVDDRGYDLLLECENVRRYIQLKSSKIIDINQMLFDLPGACVIKISYGLAHGRIALLYRYFGEGPGERFDFNRTVRVRNPNKRRILMSQFNDNCGAPELFEQLFPQV